MRRRDQRHAQVSRQHAGDVGLRHEAELGQHLVEPLAGRLRRAHRALDRRALEQSLLDEQRTEFAGEIGGTIIPALLVRGDPRRMDPGCASGCAIDLQRL